LVLIIGCAFLLLGTLFIKLRADYFPGGDGSSELSRLFFISGMCCMIFGGSWIVIAICALCFGSHPQKSPSPKYYSIDNFDITREYIRDLLRNSGKNLVDLELVSKMAGLDIDLMLRTFYELAGEGQIRGKLVHGHFFKVDGSIEEIVQQLEKMFNAWSLNDKSAKI
jgi:hypothetical protein